MSEPTGPTEPVDPTRPMPAAQQPPNAPGPSTPGAGPAPGSAAGPGQPERATFPAQAAAAPAAPNGPGPRPKGPNLYRQATSTTGGTIAFVVAAVLVLLLVVGVVGVGALAVARTVAGHGDDRRGQFVGRSEGAPGQQRKLDNPGPMGRGHGNGNGNGNGNGKANGNGNGLGGAGGLGGLGMGSMMGAAGALGDVQHGEFTVTDSTGKDVVMTVQRGTVSAASATSVTVRSADGFTATYAVDDTTRGRAGAVAKGDSVMVLAQKAGAKAVAVREVRAAT